MSKTLHAAVLAAALAIPATVAAETKPLVLPKPPAPAPAEKLPLNAVVTPTGVYVPVTKSGNSGVTLAPLPKPAPGEMGGTVNWTIKTK